MYFEWTSEAWHYKRRVEFVGAGNDARQSIGKTVVEMRKSWSIFSEVTPMPPAVTDACKQGNAAILQAMVSFGC